MVSRTTVQAATCSKSHATIPETTASRAGSARESSPWYQIHNSVSFHIRGAATPCCSKLPPTVILDWMAKVFGAGVIGHHDLPGLETDDEQVQGVGTEQVQGVDGKRG